MRIVKEISFEKVKDLLLTHKFYVDSKSSFSIIGEGGLDAYLSSNLRFDTINFNEESSHLVRVELTCMLDNKGMVYNSRGTKFLINDEDGEFIVIVYSTPFLKGRNIVLVDTIRLGDKIIHHLGGFSEL